MPRPDYTISDLRVYLDEKRTELNDIRKGGIPPVNRYLMDMGNSLGVFPDIWKTAENQVKGCTAKVYIAATEADGRMFYMAHSDSKLVRGQLALLVNGLNRLTPMDIIEHAEACISDFVKHTDVRFSMTRSRTNSMGMLFLFMQQKAIPYLH
ncbi:SufE family protein [Candidatus Neomarinimicrobiota bacterium]